MRPLDMMNEALIAAAVCERQGFTETAAALSQIAADIYLTHRHGSVLDVSEGAAPLKTVLQPAS